MEILSFSAFIQLRVWNNQDGALAGWDDAVGVSEWGDSGAAVATSGLGGPNPPDPDLTAPGMPALPGFTLVPEPTTWALLGLGALALCFRRRK